MPRLTEMIGTLDSHVIVPTGALMSEEGARGIDRFGEIFVGLDVAANGESR